VAALCREASRGVCAAVLVRGVRLEVVGLLVDRVPAFVAGVPISGGRGREGGREGGREVEGVSACVCEGERAKE